MTEVAESQRENERSPAAAWLLTVDLRIRQIRSLSLLIEFPGIGTLIICPETQLHSPGVDSDASLNPYIQGEMAVLEYFSWAVVHSFHILSHADKPAAITSLRVVQPQEQKSKNE